MPCYMSTWNVSQTSVIITNPHDNQLMRRQGSFWLAVLDVLVHALLVTLPSACGETVCHSRRHGRPKQKAGERVESHSFLREHSSSN